MTPRDFNKLKTADILTRFETWKLRISEGATIDEMKPAIQNLMEGCGFQTLTTSNGKFFRARKNIQENLFDNITDLWYPPANMVKQMGRANRAGESRMYIAQDGRTALFEMGLKEGEFVTIGQLNVKRGQSLNLIFLNTLENLNHKPFNRHISNRANRKKIYKYNNQGVENMNLIHTLLSKEFMRIDSDNPESAYTLSVAVAECILSYPRADGMIYPSLKSANDYNIVLKSQNADRKLELKRCDFLKVTHNRGKEVILNRFSTTSSIDSSTGVIHWTNQLDEDLDWNSTGTEALRKLN